MRLRGSELAHLRWSFIALGVLLLLAVGGLMSSALARLEEQRALRHRMVAERVFDEAEREIGSLLQHEAQRPSAAYDARNTDPTRWSSFVVGYYRRAGRVQLLAESQLGADRAARVRSAVGRVRSKLDAETDVPAFGSAGSSPADAEPLAPRSSPDVLRMLNRSVLVRQRRQADLAQSFIVLPVDDDTLVLERRSADGARREGLVVDVPQLVGTIEGWILGSQGLRPVASLSTRADSHGKGAQGDDRAYGFEHALAPPLDSQRVHLRLSRLDDEDAGSLLYGLSALLAAAAVLGLLALYRMVAVRVRFAERQNNFVSAVTHELRTPLTAIRMYGEMLREGIVEDEATRREYYDIISAEGERLTRLINNVMEHGELRRGQRRAHMVRANVGSVVREVVELMGPHIAAEGFECVVDIEPSLPEVDLDVDAFKQVLFNVIDNALKYGRAGADEARAVHIECARQEEQVRVSVRDSGPGVSEAHVQAVFEPFFRGEDELTRRQKGTGIGLSLVRDLVELMGGQVSGRNLESGFEVAITLRTA